MQIFKKIRKLFGKLNISVFYPLYKEFYIWNNEVSTFSLKCAANKVFCLEIFWGWVGGGGGGGGGVGGEESNGLN